MRFDNFFALGALDDRLRYIQAQARLGLLLATATVTLKTLLLKNRQNLFFKVDPGSRSAFCQG